MELGGDVARGSDVARWSDVERGSDVEREGDVERSAMARRAGEQVTLAATFAVAGLRYWLLVFPRTCRELARWRARAGKIVDPVLQRLALEALCKHGTVEGAAAFAAFVPRAHRAATIRALTAFQLAYDYVDLLAEQPSRDRVGNAQRLHSALELALAPAAPHPDYYEHHQQREDGGYLEELIDACRGALAALPSRAVVAGPASAAAARIVAFQSLSLGGLQALRACAAAQTPPASGLHWWETAAAGGSSLAVLALIAAAARPAVHPHEPAAIERAYFPWIGACHSLLDSLIDREEDARIDQLSLIGCYRSADEAAVRVGSLAARSICHARLLARGRRHAVLFCAMAGYYLSAPEAAAAEVQAICAEVRTALGPLAGPTLCIFGLRRRLSRPARPRGGRLTRLKVGRYRDSQRSVCIHPPAWPAGQAGDVLVGSHARETTAAGTYS